MEILPFGESALLIRLEQRIDLAVNEKIVTLQHLIEEAKLTGVQYVIPAYCSLVIGYDGGLISYARLKQNVLSLKSGFAIKNKNTSRLLRIPVCYQAPYALDLLEVSEEVQLPVDEVIQIHTQTTFHVFMLGFLPGFAYMGPLPEALHCSRKASPRTKVPAQSVGLAGQQTGIYPSAAPGGWQIIGRTPLPPFRGTESQPFLFHAGDQVQFYAISVTDYDQVSIAVESGTFNWGLIYG